MTIRRIFNRDFDGTDWTYHDQMEAEFAFFVWPDYSITSIDDFIEGRQDIDLSDVIISELNELRHDAFQAYKNKNIDLMMAHMRALHQACHLYGFREAAKPDLALAKDTRENQRNRRLGKPAEDPYDNERNDRICAFYKRWVEANGKYGAMKATANEFGLSPKQIGRIMKNKGT